MIIIMPAMPSVGSPRPPEKIERAAPPPATPRRSFNIQGNHSTSNEILYNMCIYTYIYIYIYTYTYIRIIKCRSSRRKSSAPSRPRGGGRPRENMVILLALSKINKYIYIYILYYMLPLCE